MMELFFDRGDVGVDVGVVELEIVEDHRPRPVMHELRAFVEESGVVFVGLDHEERSLTKSGTDAEIVGHTTDEKTRRQPCALENPGEHAGGRRLAVGARDREHPTIAQYFAREPLRTRFERNLPLEQRLDHRRTASHDVADHHHIGRGLELRRLETLDDFDAERRELRAHGRINVAVRPGHPMARGLGDRRDAAHEGAADPENVYVHDEQPTAIRSSATAACRCRVPASKKTPEIRRSKKERCTGRAGARARLARCGH